MFAPRGRDLEAFVLSGELVRHLHEHLLGRVLFRAVPCCSVRTEPGWLESHRSVLWVRQLG